MEEATQGSKLNFLILIMAVIATGCASIQTIKAPPTIALEKPVYFPAADDDMEIIAVPGYYHLEQLGPKQLRLVSLEGKDPLVIEGTSTQHTEIIDSPTALVVPAEEDTVHLLLLLPDKTGIDAVGTYSGVRPRGLFFAPLKTAQISQTFATRPANAMVQVSGGPPPPVLRSPGPNFVIGNENVTFSWQPAPAGTAPTRYQVCITEENKTCDSPGAWVYPFSGQPPITTTNYTARLWTGLKGKRLQWTVASCGPRPQSHLKTIGGTPPESCAYAVPRPIRWSLQPPLLALPPNGTIAPLRPTFTIRQSVTGADRYLFCISKPGVACPTNPTNSSQTVVIEVRGTLHYTPPQDLLQFKDQTVHWTAAACNTAFGCVYQQSVQSVTLRPAAPRPISDAELAYRWAPIHYQDTAGDGKADFITSFTYDGDWYALNNWDNLHRHPLRAHVYYSIVESQTHWFIAYGFFHPRDWASATVDFLHGNDQHEHENDMEGLLMIVRKDGTPYGRLEGLVSNAHKDFYSYVPPGSPLQGGPGGEELDGVLMMREYDGSLHPVTAQEAHGHGLKAWPQVAMDGNDFRGGDGVIYYPSRTTAEVPSHKNDRDVKYRLIDFFALGGVWDHRRNPNTFVSANQPTAFRGDKSGGCGGATVDLLTCQTDSAKPPWLWDDHNDPVDAGVITKDPVAFTQMYFRNLGDFSTQYVRNPYQQPW